MVKITCTLYITVLTILTEHAFSYGKAVCMIIFIPSRVMLKETFVSMGTFWEPFEPPGQAGSLGLTPHHSNRLNWWGGYEWCRGRIFATILRVDSFRFNYAGSRYNRACANNSTCAYARPLVNYNIILSHNQHRRPALPEGSQGLTQASGHMVSRKNWSLHLLYKL